MQLNFFKSGTSKKAKEITLAQTLKGLRNKFVFYVERKAKPNFIAKM